MVAIKIGRTNRLKSDLKIQKLLERRFLARHKNKTVNTMTSYGIPYSLYYGNKKGISTIIFPRYAISFDDILNEVRCNKENPYSDQTIYKFLDKMVKKKK